ncbi:leucine-rich repeat domain-containing protein [Bacillus tianshenii]|uniref:leucine-rich repeat domain-containing protein n=1 Tax=Sutcliffiella tianshenii TaxID=1463404 RepID=UPI001CD353D5|nr:leucine-rich repeat domain-containing protein [Bacillus tianshenii]MCA1320403.1 leucine-rich repeat domain-containing protein [Bacillus tianshenii]
MIFSLVLSLLSPVAALAEGTESSAGVLLTKALQSEEGVSLVWETFSSEDVTGKDQSFLLVKNGQSEEIIPTVIEEESSETRTVYTYVDIAEVVASTTEYSVVWNLEESVHNSNILSFVKEELPAPSPETNNEVGETAAPAEIKEEKLLQNSVDEDPIAEDESFLYLEALYISENSFHASWYGEVAKSLGRVAKYELYLNDVLVKSGNVRFTEHLFTNLTPDTTYQVSVKAFNASNVQVLEESMEVTTFSEPSGEIVQFPDAQLTQAIKTQLGIEREIFESDLDRLTTLHAADLGITDLTGLEKAVNLEILYLYFNDISDITPLAGLTKLVDLDLDGNNISNITPLSGLSNLTTLWLANNPVTDIQVVEGLTNLEYLYLHGTDITDIQGLLSLTHLTHITLSDTELDLTEGSPVWDIINVWADAGVYIDILDDTVFESLELWQNAATEESIHLSWWYSLENEEDYEKEYHFKVYVNGVLHTETTDMSLIVSGLDADTEYEVLVEMYNADEELMFEATTIAATLPAPSGEVVTFADSALEDAIRHSLYIFSGRAIYQSDMERLEHLYAGGMGITDLSGLEYAINLLYLDLHSNEVEDLTPLLDLPLFSLDISGNPISDASVLTSLVNLESLFLHYTKINDISFLLDFAYLYEVTLFGIEGLTFAEGTPERAIVDELLELGVVNVYLSEDDYIGPTPVEINVLHITDNSIEIDWTYEGEEEVAYYAILMNQELVTTVTDTHFLFTDLLADTSYDIAVAAFDKDDNWLGLTEISVSTLPLNVDEEDDTNEETPAEEEEGKENEEGKNEEAAPVVKPEDKTTGPAKTETKTSTDKKADGNKLPNTATNTMNYILFGVALLMAGLIIVRGLTRSSLKR